jgi:hypothetical protein
MDYPSSKVQLDSTFEAGMQNKTKRKISLQLRRPSP